MDASTMSSMLASPLPPSFLDTYSLSTSSLGCNDLCIVISFLVLWSICLSSSLVHLREGKNYMHSMYLCFLLLPLSCDIFQSHLFGLVSLFNDISNFVCYLIRKPSF